MTVEPGGCCHSAEPSKPLPVHRRVLLNLVKHLTQLDTPVDTTFDVVHALVHIVGAYHQLGTAQKKHVAVLVLRDIAAGPDSVLGTPDDLLPQHVLAGLTMLIESNLLASVVEVLFDVTTSVQVTTAVTGWVGACQWLAAAALATVCCHSCCCCVGAEPKEEEEALMDWS